MENNYQLSRIHNYIHGLMSKEEMFQLEKEALEDPFLQDALEGYRLQNGVDVKQLSLLQQRLDRRLTEQEAIKNHNFFGWQRLTIAATAAVLFVAVLTLLYFRNFSEKATRTTAVEMINPEGVIAVEPLVQHGDATPIAGWTAFEKYMNAKTSDLTLSGEYTISFKVTATGELTSIIVLPNLVKSEEQHIEKLLKEGSKWQGKQGTIKLIFPKL